MIKSKGKFSPSPAAEKSILKEKKKQRKHMIVTEIAQHQDYTLNYYSYFRPPYIHVIMSYCDRSSVFPMLFS